MRAKPSPTFLDPLNYSSPCSSVHGIRQARVLEWFSISFSGDLPNPRIEPGSPTLQADGLLSEPPNHAKNTHRGIAKRTLERNHEQSENRDQTGSHAFPPAVPPPLCDQLSGQTGDAEGKWKRWEAGSTESQGKETEQGQPPRLCGSHSPPLGPKSPQGPAWRTMVSASHSQARRTL